MRWISTSLENVLEIYNEKFTSMKNFLDHPGAQYQYRYEYWYQYHDFECISTNTGTCIGTGTGTSINIDTSTMRWISSSLENVLETYNDI